MTATKDQYSSRLAAIITMVGVAVGLGNVWRFPYMMGSYGGSAFLIMYLVFTLLLAFPALVTEMALGKNVPSGVIAAFESTYGQKVGKWIGRLLVFVVTITASYYAVVVANVMFTGFFSLFIGFTESSNSLYQELLGNGSLQYLLTVALIIGGYYTCARGLKKGIERISKIIMPLFILSILYMILHAWMQPGAIEQVGQFLKADFGAIGSDQIFAALGQAFFSLGLGGTFVVVYSSYISNAGDIPKLAFYTSLGDVGSSLLVSLFLVPSFLVLAIPMDAGPSLIFNTFPELFSQMPGGRFVGSLFLISLFLVAFLSLVASYQVPISSLESSRIPKRKLILILASIQLILTIPTAFKPEIIGIMDLIFGSGMQVLGSFMAVLGIWWGIKKGFYLDLLFRDPASTKATVTVFWLRWVVAGTLIAVLIGYIQSNV